MEGLTYQHLQGVLSGLLVHPCWCQAWLACFVVTVDHLHLDQSLRELARINEPQKSQKKTDVHTGVTP